MTDQAAGDNRHNVKLLATGRILSPLILKYIFVFLWVF
jgi:hypothetical protein